MEIFNHEFPRVNKLYAKDLAGLPAGTLVSLIWKDRHLGEMRSLYRLTGDGRMQNLNRPESIIPVEDLPGKFYVIAGDEEKTWSRWNGRRDGSGKG